MNKNQHHDTALIEDALATTEYVRSKLSTPATVAAHLATAEVALSSALSLLPNERTPIAAPTFADPGATL